MFLARLRTPVGTMILAASDAGLEEARFPGQKHFSSLSDAEIEAIPFLAPGQKHPSAVIRQAASELEAYFVGSLRDFSIPLTPKGTAFQQSVWRALLQIPYGETRTYAQIAALAGTPGSYRAAGAAVGRNPIGVIVPCHRVLGSDGALTGYAGGLDRKKRLLDLEVYTNR